MTETETPMTRKELRRRQFDQKPFLKRLVTFWSSLLWIAFFVLAQLVLIFGALRGFSFVNYLGTMFMRQIDPRLWPWWYFVMLSMLLCFSWKWSVDYVAWRGNDMTEEELEKSRRFKYFSLALTAELGFLVFLNAIGLLRHTAKYWDFFIMNGHHSLISTSYLIYINGSVILDVYLFGKWIRKVKEELSTPLPAGASHAFRARPLERRTAPAPLSPAPQAASPQKFMPGAQVERTSLRERFRLPAFQVNGTMLLIIAGTILGLVFAGMGYWLLTTDWVDQEGYPITLSWWVWPLFFSLLIGSGIGVKVLIQLKDANNEGVFRRQTPETPKPQVKPKGFNVQAPKGGGFHRK